MMITNAAEAVPWDAARSIPWDLREERMLMLLLIRHAVWRVRQRHDALVKLLPWLRAGSEARASLTAITVLMS